MHGFICVQCVEVTGRTKKHSFIDTLVNILEVPVFQFITPWRICTVQLVAAPSGK